MPGPDLSPRYVRTTLLLMMSSLLVTLVGFSTPAWTSSELAVPTPFGDAITSHVTTGLWRACVDDVCGSVKADNGWLLATRAFVTLGLLAGLMSTILFLLYIFVDRTHNAVIYLDIIITSLVQVVCVLLAVCIYGSNAPVNLAWSFAFTIAGMCLEFLAASILIVKRWFIQDHDEF
ncbi:uncharacterized protein LOC110450899 [Mizuhopecten yessoensis]|uniref:uncharacterized protein LOC110450899 n=1 Tax=Mizuhopecten yessoensis TaxID=6573 RepID=UPI000B45B231|nr:uncharacterized protein LOC110450899 [Mizuhopecten yessoensis]